MSDAKDEDELLRDLERELKTLVAAPIESIETTLLIHPHAMANFLDYNDFLDPAEALIERLDLEGVIQIASFHPQYQFAGHGRRRRGKLHEPFAVSDAAFVTRGEHHASGRRRSRAGRDSAAEH